MTTFWSKILEGLVARFTLEETGNNWKNDQFGGRKGSSTDHVLVEIWNKILTGLDTGAKAVVLAAIDFSKSFSRCSHQEILKFYQKLGLSDWGIAMHAAFLTERKMRVKIGNVLSDEMRITGCAVQGSVLGVMDHNAVLEFINDNIDSQDMYKYVDDLTLEERIEKSVPYLQDSSEERTSHTFKAEKTQATFDLLSENCASKGLKINDEKLSC